MEMLEKDIKVAILAFKADDFQLVNILGNRIMSDSVFLENIRLGVVGFYIKQVALSYINLKPQLAETEFLEAKFMGEKYINTLPETNNIGLDQSWINYHKFNIDLIKYPSTGFEKQIADVYGHEPEITSQIREWLIKFLIDNKTVLFDIRNDMLKGILSEFQRVGLAFGYELTDTIIYSILLALERYYDYYKFQYTDSGEIDKESVKNRIFPYIERLNALISTKSLNFEKVNSLLWDLIKGWRESFIYYQEILPRKSQQIELSKEAKSKLSEAVGKALQKELKT